MTKFKQLSRFIYINWIIAQYGLDEIVLSTPLLYSLRYLAYVNPWNWRKHRTSRGERIRLALTALGPIFVKFGQMLSTRRDLLPDDIAHELAKLQDRVPPFEDVKAQAIVEEAYGKPLAELFASFEVSPLASASIAQVHAAKLLDGKDVVIKILRPGIEKIIQRDLALLYSFAGILERYWSEGRRLRPRDVITEFEYSLSNELDLNREAANAAQLRRNFAGSALLYVPEVYWHYVRNKVMVMERVRGIPISQIETFRQAQVNLKKLAERGVEIFFTQVFRDCFFHADMHPGNIFADITDPENPRYIAVDFGIMGTLSRHDQRYLAENFLAFFRRDYRRVAELHIESGWVPFNTRVDELEAAVRGVCEPAFGLPLKEISFGTMLLRLFQMARQFNMEVQPQLVLLQKTLLNIEGLGRQLYPDLDLWSTAKPYMERWMHEQLGPRALLRKIREKAPYWAERLPEIPDLIYEILRYKNDIVQQQRTQAELLPYANSQYRSAKREGFWWGVIVTLLSTTLAAMLTLYLPFQQHEPIQTIYLNKTK